MARRYSLSDRRQIRINEDRRECLNRGLCISPELRAAVDAGVGEVVYFAILTEAQTVPWLPVSLVSAWNDARRLPTAENFVELARTARDVLVNVPTLTETAVAVAAE